MERIWTLPVAPFVKLVALWLLAHRSEGEAYSDFELSRIAGDTGLPQPEVAEALLRLGKGNHLGVLATVRVTWGGKWDPERTEADVWAEWEAHTLATNHSKALKLQDPHRVACLEERCGFTAGGTA